MEARSSVGSTLIANRCEPEQWYVRFSGELIADGTPSRLAGSARHPEFEGHDTRRRDAALD